jgi:glycine oxidase
MNIAIVGAGVVGRLTAMSLIDANHNVTIYDKHPLDTPDNAAFASAGMLCPLGEIIHAPRSVLDMGLWSLNRWSDLLKILGKQDPYHEQIFYQSNGSLAVAFPQDESCFKQLEQDLRMKACTHIDSIDWLDQQQLEKIEPNLGQFNQAAFLKTEGQLCNRSFLSASTRALNAQAQVIDQRELQQKDIEQLSSEFEWVIDCRGSGAIEQQGRQLPDNNLRGIRGEVLRVYCPEVTFNRPIRVMHPRNSIYIVPKPNHEFVIGATEVESHAEHPITLRSCLELMTTLYAIHPAFSEAQILETRVGIRTAFSDNTPKVQRSQNIISANGLYRHGWLIGPAITNKILQVINEKDHELHH